MRNELGNTLVMTLLLVTSPSVSFSLVKPVLCSVSLARGAELTAGPAMSHLGCTDRVHLAVAPGWKFNFLYLFFSDFVTSFKNLYLGLGVSKWGEQNFVRIIMKCSI